MDDYKRSLYDAVQENFKVAGRKHFLHRIIYIGEHKFAEHHYSFQEFMAGKIKHLHEAYCDEVLTGLFIVYTAYFVHLIEGSEDTLMRHLRSVCNDDAQLDRLKVLLVTHHINQRYFSKWESSVCHPPMLFERIDPESSLEETARQVKICIGKVYRLMSNLRSQSTMTFRSMVDNLSDRFAALLPECALLEFLLGSNMLCDLREYTGNFQTVPAFVPYSETVWPAPCEYVPTNVLDSLPKPKTHVAGLVDDEYDDELEASASDGLAIDTNEGFTTGRKDEQPKVEKEETL